MSQPPGGYPPPPEQPPSGGYPGGFPPPPPAGPPPGGAPGGYPPPPAGGYPPPPAPGAYPPPAAPPPAGPPPGAYAPPGQQQPPPPGYGAPGAYPPPAQGGYGPPPPGYAPQGPGSGAPSFDPSKVSIAGWGVMGAALLTLIASFFSFWSVSYAAVYIGYGFGLSGWSLWWWIPVLIALAVGVAYALTLFGVLKPGQVKPEWLVYGAAGSFVLMIIVLIHTFAYNGPFGAYSDGSTGPSFGVWFALITTLALTYFTALAAQSAGARLPIKVPGPA
ncbi:hypothetical protein [Nakamurella alba]|uniref:hypothetical protein n=1 Tax=Nakamurella alba TaxID=2665158 RepID=UPI0018AAB703|nr:hypothetical protein [Nakamurella alba]